MNSSLPEEVLVAPIFVSEIARSVILARSQRRNSPGLYLLRHRCSRYTRDMRGNYPGLGYFAQRSRQSLTIASIARTGPGRINARMLQKHALNVTMICTLRIRTHACAPSEGSNGLGNRSAVESVDRAF